MTVRVTIGMDYSQSSQRQKVMNAAQMGLLGDTRNPMVRGKILELLDIKGEIDLSNIIVHYRPTDDYDPFQTDIYTLRGEGVERS